MTAISAFLSQANRAYSLGIFCVCCLKDGLSHLKQEASCIYVNSVGPRKALVVMVPSKGGGTGGGGLGGF